MASTQGSLLDHEVTFADYGKQFLKSQITKAIAKMGIIHPTLVQSKCIPLAVDGKDVLAKARTGSGKTLAYLVPVLQRLLKLKEQATDPAIRAVVLVPTRELVTQVHQALTQLMYYCHDLIKAVQLGNESIDIQKARLAELPDIVVTTPSRLVAHLLKGNLNLKDNLLMLVIDEADLILSFGYQDDMKVISDSLPKIYQALVLSATLTDEVEELKKLILHNPVTLKLEEPETSGNLSQHYIQCKSQDKLLLMYALLKLKLVQGKSIIFVNSVDGCYRLKLFLEQFSIDSAVLNAELPHKSREHILQSFNQGLFDYLITTDQSIADQDEDEQAEAEEEEEEDLDEDEDEDEDGEEEEDDEEEVAPKMKKQKTSHKDEEEDGDEEEEEEEQKSKKNKKSFRLDRDFGVSRGIDFKGVTTVINLDFPLSNRSYTHRVGRTARAGATGTALSLVAPEEVELLKKVIVRQQKEAGRTFDDEPVVQPLHIRMSEIEGFRYRVEDVVRAVTTVAVKEARLKEIKREILNSDKLKSYFEDNPKDIQALKHDKALRPSKVQSHLAFVPGYLLPPSLVSNPVEQAVQKSKSVRKPSRNMMDPRKRKREDDPLQSFRVNPKVEHPLHTAPEDLKPNSGRKLWKLRHNKKLKKSPKLKKQLRM